MDAQNSTAKGIYIWRFPNGRVYIGRAQNFAKRYKDYIKESLNPKRHVAYALRYYGVENCKFEVIETIDFLNNDHMNLKESLWIKHFDSTNPEKGYNITKFSTSQYGVKRSEKTKKIQSLIKKGKPSPRKGAKLSLETRKKIGEAQKGKKKPISDFRRNQLIKYHPSRKNPEKYLFTKEKFSQSAKKREIQSHFKKVIESSKTPILQFNLKGEFIKSWNSMMEAGDSFKKGGNKNIHIALKKNGTAYGFRWQYAKEKI